MYLLDTHALLWWMMDSPELPDVAKAVIADPENDIFVSAASVWEISIKRALGKLEVLGDLVEAVNAEGFEQLPITIAAGDLAGSLPPIHRDPFDRMLIAQAQLHSLVLISKDADIVAYGGQTFWG